MFDRKKKKRRKAEIRKVMKTISIFVSTSKILFILLVINIFRKIIIIILYIILK